MGFSLFPKTYKFYEMFELQHQKIIEAIELLNDIFNNPEETSRKSKEITLIEMEGNRISREITKLLSMTFITPIDREDIHEVNVAQEALLNTIKGIANRVNMYSVCSFSDSSKELIENFKMIIDEHTHILKSMIKKKDPGESVRRVKKLKEDSDAILMRGIQEIYNLKVNDEHIVLEIIKWTQIYDRIEKAIVRADNLANILEGICLKYA